MNISLQQINELYPHVNFDSGSVEAEAAMTVLDSAVSYPESNLHSILMRAFVSLDERFGEEHDDGIATGASFGHALLQKVSEKGLIHV